MRRSMRAISIIVILFLGTGSATVFNAATLNSVPTIQSASTNSGSEYDIITAAIRASQTAIYISKVELVEAQRAERSAQIAEQAVNAAEREPWSVEKAAKAEHVVKEALEAEKAAKKAAEEVAAAVRKAERIVRDTFVTKTRIEAATGKLLRIYTVGAVQKALTDATVWETLGFDTANAVDLATRIKLAPNETRQILHRMSLYLHLSFQVTIVDKMHINLAAGIIY